MCDSLYLGHVLYLCKALLWEPYGRSGLAGGAEGGRENLRKGGSFKGGSQQGCREGALEAVFFSQRLRGWLLNLVTGLK